jgi:hypothetical protein
MGVKASDVQSSPYSTGGGGTTLEHEYGAVLMTHILSGHPLGILGDEFTPTRLSFQVPQFPVDDFVLDGDHPNGSIRSVAIAVRRDPKLVETNKASVKLLASFIAFLSVHAADLTTGSWRLAIAVSADSVHAKQLRTLIEIARDQPSNLAFRTAVKRPGRTDNLIRNRLVSLDKVVAKALKETKPGHSSVEAAEMTWSILSALHVHSLLLEGAATNDRTAAIAALRGVHPLGTAKAASDLFRTLSDLSARYAASAAVKGSLQLQRDLGLRISDGLSERQLAWTKNLETKVTSRRRERRSIVGLSDKQVNASFEWDAPFPDKLGQIASGDVLCLTGPIGSGKSDMAERWLLDAAKEFKSSKSFSLPVWLRAEEIVGPLEQTVRTELAGAAPPEATELDVSIVIDGVDERPTGADSLALDAKVFTTAHPRSRVLLTTRQGAISLSVDAVPVPELTAEEAESLISRLSEGSRAYTYNWPESLRTSIKRPLFAMLAGAQRGDNRLSTPASLIRTAAEHGARGTVDTGILRKLATALTRAGKAVDPLIALPGISGAGLRASRLIVFEGVRCRFALPVFQQWFAAEALLTGEVSLDEVTADLLSFAKWRYALAACLSSGTRESTDPIMNRVAQWNPGAIGWLVKESLPSTLGTGDGATVDAWRVEAQRIWTATKSICEGLGTPATRLVRPTRALDPGLQDPFGLLSLNLQTDDRRIAQNWRLKTEERRRFTNEQVHWLSAESDYITAKMGAPIDNENWLWRWVLSDLSGDLSKALEDRATLNLVARDGVVAQEQVSWICRELLIQRQPDIRSTKEVIFDRVNSAFDSAASVDADMDKSSFSFGGRATFQASELQEVLAALETDPRAGEDVWPGPDLGHGGWVWSGYSKERMLQRVRGVYEGAMMAYVEIRSAIFSSFGLTMGHAALFPAKIVGSLRYDPDDQSWGGGPVLSYSIRPHSPDRSNEKGAAMISYLEPSDPSLGFQEAVAELDSHFTENPEAALFGRATYVQTALEIFHRRPATYIALDWLWSDLAQLGWVSGSRPRR